MGDGQVRFVYRHYPFLGDESFRAAQASECAAEQGEFWEYHEKLFAEWQGENVGAFSDPNLVRFASDIGLDAAALDDCLASNKYADLVTEQRDGGADAGVSSTPTVFVDGEVIKGLQDYGTYQAAVQDALQAGN